MLSRQSRKTAFKVALVSLILSAGIALAAYHMTVLEPAGRQYISTLQPAVKRLETASQRLAKASETHLISRTQDPLESKLAHIEKLRQEVLIYRRELKTFRVVSGQFTHHQASLTSATYTKANTLREQGDATSAQIEDILKEYDALLLYLNDYYSLRHHVTSELDAINTLPDLNVLQDRDEQIWATASALELDMNEFATRPTPRGFENLSNRLADNDKKTLAAFRNLAYGLDPPIDAAIYSAASEIESAALENDLLSTTVFDETITSAPVLRSVSDLPETTDRFRF